MSDDYWRRFVHTVSFLEPTSFRGRLVSRDQDGPKNDPYPVLILELFRPQTDEPNGYRARVNVTQTRLLGELIRTRPAVGDVVEIIYHGPAPKAPPGMSPVKEFSVHVERAKSSPQERPPGKSLGEVSGENVPGGKK